MRYYHSLTVLKTQSHKTEGTSCSIFSLAHWSIWIN